MNFLHAILAERGDEAIADSGGLQLIHGVMQVNIASLPQACAGLASSGEDGERARPGGWLQD